MSDGAFRLLLVVEGPSEATGRRGDEGVLEKVVRETLGLSGPSVEHRYWNQKPYPPPGRQGNEDGGYGGKTRKWIRLVRSQGKGVKLVLLRDNDRDDWVAARGPTAPKRLPARLQELRDAISAEGAGGFAVAGIAVETIEAWLLSDPGILPNRRGVTSLPAGKNPEGLWGDRSDPSSNHPKRVFQRCVLDEGGWEYREAVEHWNVATAAERSTWLGLFVNELSQIVGTA